MSDFIFFKYIQTAATIKLSLKYFGAHRSSKTFRPTRVCIEMYTLAATYPEVCCSQALIFVVWYRSIGKFTMTCSTPGMPDMAPPSQEWQPKRRPPNWDERGTSAASINAAPCSPRKQRSLCLTLNSGYWYLVTSGIEISKISTQSYGTNRRAVLKKRKKNTYKKQVTPHRSRQFGRHNTKKLTPSHAQRTTHHTEHRQAEKDRSAVLSAEADDTRFCRTYPVQFPSPTQQAARGQQATCLPSGVIHGNFPNVERARWDQGNTRNPGVEQDWQGRHRTRASKTNEYQWSVCLCPSVIF